MKTKMLRWTDNLMEFSRFVGPYDTLESDKDSNLLIGRNGPMFKCPLGSMVVCIEKEISNSCRYEVMKE